MKGFILKAMKIHQVINPMLLINISSKNSTQVYKPKISREIEEIWVNAIKYNV